MEKKEKKSKIGIGTGGVIAIAIIYLLLGLACVFFPGLEIAYILYGVSIVLFVFGIALIVRYFMSGAYHDLGKYGFSGGVLSLAAGFCLLIRVEDVAAYFILFLGICILLTAVIKLQNAIDLSTMNQKTWTLFLVIALIFMIIGVFVILNPFKWINEDFSKYIYYVLIVDGVVSLISTGYMALAIKQYYKKLSEPKDRIETSEEDNEACEEVEKTPDAAPDPIPDGASDGTTDEIKNEITKEIENQIEEQSETETTEEPADKAQTEVVSNEDPEVEAILSINDDRQKRSDERKGFFGRKSK